MGDTNVQIIRPWILKSILLKTLSKQAGMIQIMLWNIFLLYSFAEADGRKEEIEESLERLEALGFSVNTQLTTGRKDWLGSIIVLTK